MSSSVSYVLCPFGQWTMVSNAPAPFGVISVWLRAGKIEVRWKRYQAGVPFFTESSGILTQGENKWNCVPDLVNSWWFYPVNPGPWEAYIGVS